MESRPIRVEMKKLALVFLCCSFLVSFLGCDQLINNSTTKSNIEQTPDVKKTGEVTDAQNENGKRVAMTLYFANEDNSAVLKEKREIIVNNGAIMRAAVEALLEGPKEEGHKKTIPDGTRILGIKRDNDTAVVDFSKEYKSVNDIAEVVERISIVNTLTEISGIQKVRILVEGKELTGPDGKPFGDMTRTGSDSDVNSATDEVKTITLYFADPDSEKVVAERRKVTVESGQALEKVVFEELCKGPGTDSLFPTIPENTKLLSVETAKDGTCRLNLSQEFIKNASGGSAGEAITLNSIVNSLTEIPGVKSVQFLIEGKIRDAYTHVEFDKPFKRDESSIKK